LAFLAGRPAAACGGGGVTTVTSTETTEGVVADSQRIVFALRGEGTSAVTTDIVAQIGVPRTSDDYGVLIPTPVPPALDAEPISSDDLDALDVATRPIIERRSTTTFDDGGGSGSGCGCVAGGAKGDDGASPPSGTNAVTVSSPVNIGPVIAVVLKSDDASALTDWLDENGFAIPADQTDLVQTYVDAGNSFIALKRSNAVSDGGPSSIGVHYVLEGDYRQVSLRFARLGAAPRVSFTVFVSAKQPVEGSGAVENLDLTALDVNLIDTDYAGAVFKAVAGRSPAFVTEGTFNPPLSAGISDRFRSLLGYGVITRASTVVARQELVADAVFDQPAVRRSNKVTIEGERVIVLGSSASLLPALLLARGLRRRFGRRATKAA
jgi:hypothetical protein